MDRFRDAFQHRVLDLAVLRVIEFDAESERRTGAHRNFKTERIPGGIVPVHRETADRRLHRAHAGELLRIARCDEKAEGSRFVDMGIGMLLGKQEWRGVEKEFDTVGFPERTTGGGA